MRRLCSLLGMPQNRFASIHVVGTNGKTSVARMTAALLDGARLRALSEPAPLDDDVARVPCRAALCLQRLVVLVDDNARGEAGTRRPGRAPRADHHVDTAGRARPVVGLDRHGEPGCA
jgi:hypothetical protein